jgi:hypothetical protein
LNWNNWNKTAGFECVQVFENKVARDGIGQHYISPQKLTRSGILLKPAA